MMKNKKLAALLGLLLAGSMTVSMAACGSTNSASDTKADSSSQSSDSSSSDSSSDSGAGFEEVPVGPSGTAEEQDQDAGEDPESPAGPVGARPPFLALAPRGPGHVVGHPHGG